MPNLVLATVVSEVRLDCGGPSTLEITDAAIQAKVTAAVVHFNMLVGRSEQKLGTLVTVQDQQAYGWAADCGRVLDVFWLGALFSVLPQFDLDIPMQAQLFPRGDEDFRSVQLIYEMKRKELRNISTLGYNWDVIAGQIWLDPAPSTSGLNVKYLYETSSSDVTTIDAKYSEHVILYAASLCLRQIAMRRLNTGVIDREGLTARANVPMLVKEAEAKEAKFEKMMTRVAR